MTQDWDLRGVELEPKPQREGGPPFWVGATVARDAALRRTGRVFDGWIPTAPNAETWASGWSAIQRAARERSAQRDAVTPAAYLTLSLDRDVAAAEARLAAFYESYYGLPFAVMRRVQGCFAGTPEDCAAWLAGYARAGVAHFVLRSRRSRARPRAAGSRRDSPAARLAREEPRMTSPDAFYAAAKVEHCSVEDATLAVRRFGSGPPLLFVHGFPTHGYTWRRCCRRSRSASRASSVDLPGLGDSGWTRRAPTSASPRRRAGSRALLSKLGLDRCALVAHDTGATVARLVALAAPERVAKLALINTEIPGHRPPWIPLYQTLTRAAGRRRDVSPAAAQPRGSCARAWASASSTRTARLFDDPDAPRRRTWTRSLASRAACGGCSRYLRGIEWDVVDGLRDGPRAHRRRPCCFLWGEDDRHLPGRARRAHGVAVRRPDALRAHRARVADAARGAPRGRARRTSLRSWRRHERPTSSASSRASPRSAPQPSVASYLALFHPDATLFDSGMERPITVPEIAEHIGAS